MSRSVKQDYASLIGYTRRGLQIEWMKALAAELQARNAVRREFTAENLTAWVTAKNNLEDRKRAL